ncbi:drug/metabolite transporter (DMT)-like permease [Streptomyces sp. DSM 41269]|nr:drug/metabolite transporter (DMT)-like permease [Streptomyces sp. DSM 41269]
MNATSLRGVLLAAFACVLVGASFTANSVLGDYPFAGGQALRYGLAALLLVPLLRGGTDRASDRLRRLTPRQWGRVALLAAVGMVGFNLAVLAAEQSAEPAVPGVFVGCAPIVVGVLVPLLERRRPARTTLYAAGLVAAGAFAVQGWGRTDATGVLFSVGALVGEVGFAVLAVPVLRPLGPKLLSATVCAVAAVESALLGAVLDGGSFLRVPTGGEAAALLWQAAVVTVIGFVCWYSGIQHIGAERATLFSGLIPVSAALTAPLVGAGTYGLAQGAGSLLVGIGVAYGSGVLRRRPAADAPGPGRPGAGRPGSAAGVQDDAGHQRRVVVHRDVPAAGQPHEPGVGEHPLGADPLPAQQDPVGGAPGDGDRDALDVLVEGGAPAGRHRGVEPGRLAQGERLGDDGLG